MNRTLGLLTPTWPRRPRLALAGLGGVMLAFGQAPFGLWPVAVIGLVALFWAMSKAADLRQGAWTGWVAGAAYFAVTLHWIVEPFQVDAAATGWMAPFALVFLAGGLALFWAMAGAVAGRLGSGLALALALCAAEYLRAYIFTGFPWGLIAGVWLDTPLAGWLPLIGPHGLGMMTLICVAAALSRLARLRALGIAAAICAVLGGWIALPRAVPIPDDAPVVRLVQPNAPQHLKWDPDWIDVFYERQLDMVAAPGRPDLTVLPETAVALRLPRDQADLTRIALAAQGRPVVLGMNRFIGPRVFNSLVALAPDGQIAAQYDKAHLVPFGEYIPFGDALGKIGIYGLATTDGGGFSAGPGPHLLDLGPIGAALPLLCYEAIFPNFGRAESRDAAVMLHLTNDAWFGAFAGPQQHLALARMRALERGVPVIRAANTGISAMIDATGQITGQIGLNQTGYLDLPLPPRRAVTLYARLGDSLFWVILALGIAALWYGGRRGGTGGAD